MTIDNSHSYRLKSLFVLEHKLAKVEKHLLDFYFITQAETISLVERILNP